MLPDDPQFPDRRAARERQEQAIELAISERMARRFAVQQLVLQCVSLMDVDALMYPTSNLPPPKLGAPREPAINGRGNSWSMLGREGFPAMTVPAGFTTFVYDRERDPGAPIRAAGEPTLLRIGYEAATKHRRQPQSFGPLPGEP